MDFDVPVLLDIDVTTHCRGAYYRYRRNTWHRTKTGLGYGEELRFLRRGSCPGCADCWPMKDFLAEFPDQFELAKDVVPGDRVIATWVCEGDGDDMDCHIRFVQANPIPHK